LEQEGAYSDLNNETCDDFEEINRGVELLLRNRRGVQSPKTFQIKFEKVVSLFYREMQISFNFHLNFKKKSLGE